MEKTFERRLTVLRRLIYALLVALSVTSAGWAKQAPTDLTELTLEELMNIEIIAVSKKPERLSEAAAAIFVITQEDIRRSGVTSIPEALRMVPGIEVARIDANKWAITSRGFNDRMANKLLVLIDGRVVYTPVFSGVFWEAQDVLLEDVERIEVLRGPATSLWGTNALNGIINVVTKRARNTQGVLVSLGGGSEERGFGSVRYGGRLGTDAYYRVYAKYFNRDNSVYTSGDEAADGWDVLRGGFRMDWNVSGRNTLTLQGDTYGGDLSQRYNIVYYPNPPYWREFDYDVHIAGVDVVGRWEHTFSNTSDMALQLFYDWIEREEAVFKGTGNAFDLDFQHRFAWGKRQEIVWGLGYRFTNDESKGTFTISTDPDSRNYDLFSAFVQDEIALVKDRLRLRLGSKFEHNDFTGFEVQPNARLLWTPREWHTAWAAVSRAVRTPSRADDDMRVVADVSSFPGTAPTFVVVFGDRDFESEELLAYELGYRLRPRDRLLVDLATFYNIYDKLRTLERGDQYSETLPSQHSVIPFTVDNKMKGETYGVELAADWWVLGWWRLRFAYAYLQMQLHLDEDSKDVSSEGTEGFSPDHQLSLWSWMDLPGGLALDVGARYVDNLPSLDVPSYFNLDVRLGWNPIESLEISVVGQNLLKTYHPEFTPPAGLQLPIKSITVPTMVERGAYGKITWVF